MAHNASDYGYSILGQLPAAGEPQWSRDYWRAKDEGRLGDAYSIAYDHQADFDWLGEYPADWSTEEIEEHSLSGLA